MPHATFSRFVASIFKKRYYKLHDMKKSILLASVVCFITLALFAQRPSETGKLISYTEGGVLQGNPNNDNKAPFIFHSSLNYAFHKNLSGGIGVGAEFLQETYLPITANLLYQFGDKKEVTPFIRLQAGYQAPLESNTYMNNTYYYYYGIASSYWPGYYYSSKLKTQGGFMANPSAGVILYTHSGLGISLAAGYRFQKLKFSGEENYNLFIEYNRLSLTLGIIF
jgi:hypothetical protein